MFTGIVQDLGTVQTIKRTKAGRRIVVAGKIKADPGDSIAINGCCLTVVECEPLGRTKHVVSFDAIPETLRKTNLGELKKGSRVNLEPALRAGDPLGGHFVLGHVDGTGVVSKFTRGKEAILRVDVDPSITAEMVKKGSAAIDGVSLTVVEVGADYFTVALIPFTLKVTTLGRLKKGSRVNLETDILGKYICKQRDGVSLETLQKAGFVK